MIECEPGKLDKACCYLSGPMEYVEDNGVGWRKDFIQLVIASGLRIDFIDPTDKPGGIENQFGNQEDKDFQKKLKEQGRFKELQAYVNHYRRLDLRSADHCNFLVAVVDPTIPQWGTSNEVYVAEGRHIPRFFVIEGGMYRLPNWLFDVIDINDDNTSDNVFETLEELVEHLCKLDSGVVPMDHKWVLLAAGIEANRYF